MPYQKETYNLDLSSLPALSNKVILVTGGTAGLGQNTIRILASQPQPPAHIIFSGRNKQRANALITSLASAHPSVKVTFVPCDLASFQSINTAARLVLAATDRLDAFLGIAGVMCTNGQTAQGYEIHLGTNHLGHALLLKHLLPLLSATARTSPAVAPPRIILYTSEGMLLAPTIDLTQSRTAHVDAFFNNWRLYAESKLANILYVRGLTAHYPELTSVAVHPGVIMTDLVTGLDWRYRWFIWVNTIGKRVSEDQGAMNGLWALTADEKSVKRGGYYVPTGIVGNESAASGDEELAARLWEWTQRELEGEKM